MKPSRVANLTCFATYLGIALAVVFHVLSAGLSPASAQTPQPASSLYCQPGDFLIGGFCVHNLGTLPTPEQCPPGFGPVSVGSIAGCGGASSAAFSSVSFSNILRTTSLEENDLIFERLRERRERERTRRLAQFAALGGIDWTADRPGAPAAVAPVAEAPVSAIRPALWAQGFGDWEHRDAVQTVSLNQRSQVIDNSSRTSSGGFIGGADLTFSNVWRGEDALILGVTTGYTTSTTKSRASQSEQQVDVASIGLYGAYAIGGFSVGLTAKTDFVDLDSRFADFLNSPPFSPVFGAFQADGRNNSFGATVSYRFDLGTSGWFMEPIVGLDYTRSTFDNANQLGLTNGSTLRGRAGATFGTLYLLNDTTALQPTLGAFIFSNLNVDNGTNLTFDANSLQPVQTDEGQVRGELQAGLNVIFASGFSAFARGEFRFGDDLRGGAVRGGVRYQF